MPEDIIVIPSEEAYQGMVRNFHMGIGGCKPDPEFRVRLIQEESEEFITAVNAKNEVEAVDALCDILYVVYGAAEVFGVYLETREAARTPVPGKGEALWSALHEELEDFNLTVSDVVTTIRHFQAWNAKGKLKTELEEFAQGCWECSAEALGVDLRPFFREVHRTNMHKLKGPKREPGKQLKPDNWKPPRIKAMLQRLRVGNPPVCEVTRPRISEDPPERHDFKKEYVIPHPEGGYMCSFCGGLFISVELDVGMEMRGQ